MKTSVSSSPGVRIESQDVYGYPVFSGRKTVQPNAIVYRRDVLLAPKGDYKTPTAQHYTTQHTSLMQGDFTTRKPYNGTPSSKYFTSSSGFTAMSPSPMDYLSSNIPYNRALGKVFEALRGGTDLSVTLAEGGQVAGMLNKARKLSTYVRGWNRKSAANAWLTWVYGVKPLMSDLHGSVTQLANRAGNSLRLRGRGTSKEVTQFVYGMNDKTAAWIVIDEFERSSRVEIGLDYLPSLGYIETSMRLASLNPASIAYELLTLSFVLDWFYDIGGYLRAIETALAYPGAVANGYVTTTMRTNHKAKHIGSGRPGTTGVITEGELNGFSRRGSKQRALITSLPLPRKPTFQVKLGASRLLSAASLLAQLLGVPNIGKVRLKRVSTQRWKDAKVKVEKPTPRRPKKDYEDPYVDKRLSAPRDPWDPKRPRNPLPPKKGDRNWR